MAFLGSHVKHCNRRRGRACKRLTFDISDPTSHGETVEKAQAAEVRHEAIRGLLGFFGELV